MNALLRRAIKTILLPWIGVLASAAPNIPRVYFGPPSRALGGPHAKRQKLTRFFKNYWWHPNLLYITSGRPYSFTFIRWAKAHGVRFILNQDGVYYPAWYGAGYEVENRRLRMLHELADYVIYQSRFCFDTAQQFLHPPERPYEILYNAVDTDIFKPATVSLKRPITLITAGYFYSSKHYILEGLLSALVILRQHHSEIRLIIAGHVDGVDSLKALAVKLGVDRCTEWTGKYTVTQGVDILNRGTLFIHLKNNDPCPSVVLEAMACGLPIIYTTTGGTPELVGDGGIPIQRDVVFDRPDTSPTPTQISEAVESALLQDPLLGTKARIRVERNFSMSYWVKRHQDLFNLVLRRQGT